MARARPAHWPAVRISRGRSLGPTTTTATTTMTSNSLQAKSNIGTHQSSRPRSFKRLRIRVWPLFRSALLDLVGLLRLDGLMLVGDGARFGVLEPFLEALDALREIAHQIRDLALAA